MFFKNIIHIGGNLTSNQVSLNNVVLPHDLCVLQSSTLSMVVCLKVAVILFTGICSITCAGSSAKKPLYIGGLLPLSEADGWSRFFGYSAKVGAELAVIDINNRSDVLPDYNLVLNISDSEVWNTNFKTIAFSNSSVDLE